MQLWLLFKHRATVLTKKVLNKRTEEEDILAFIIVLGDTHCKTIMIIS